jgi:hypothetical protein
MVIQPDAADAMTMVRSGEPSQPGSRPFLIAAHPGHELRLFHWMEVRHPVVFLLTDGSGVVGEARTFYSAACCRAAGALPGSVFGAISDRAWYAAILAGDASPFFQAAAAIIAEGMRQRPTLIVSDAVEGYNPMHDLCTALAARVAAVLGVPHLTQEVTGGARGDIAETLVLDAAAQGRKRQAALAYEPLIQEVQALLRTAPEDWCREILLNQGFNWPATFDADYERIGRDRVAGGRYSAVITYREHVLTLARRLLRPD